MSLRLTPLSNAKTKEQQQIFKTLVLNKEGGRGGGGGWGEYQSRITFKAKLNHASPKTFLKQLRIT